MHDRRSAVIEGIAADALPALLAAADAFGREIDAATAADFAPRNRARRAGWRPAGSNSPSRWQGARCVRRRSRSRPDGVRDRRGNWPRYRPPRIAHAEAIVQYEAGADSLVGSEPAVRLIARGPLQSLAVEIDTDPLARFLTQRALEREQQRVEDMQAGLLEQQRIRREVRYFASLQPGTA
jgi:hypothetical protein